MRPVHAVLLLVAAVPPASAQAQQQWCAISNEGANNCSFASLADCRATMAGTGGNCMPQAPVGHRQPGNAKTPAAADTQLDALLDRVNKKSDKLLLCRGC
jgi:Protein of unknown function (DUF3551)